MKPITKNDGTTLDVCVAIPIKNEARNLEKCLPRLQCFREVWVIDSSSTDDSKKITEIFGYNYINFHWNGKFPKKRNWFLYSNFTSLEWILFIDADELVTDAFINETASILQATTHNGFWITYNNYFLGHPLNHGVTQKKLALIKNHHAFYEKIQEHNWSNLDMEVHEHPVVRGSVGRIKSKIIHQDQGSYEQIYERHLAYAQWEARRYIQIREKTSSDYKNLTIRQRVKYFGIASRHFSKIYFFIHYFMLLGFLDKREGLNYAILKYKYFKKIYEEIHKLKAA